MLWLYKKVNTYFHMGSYIIFNIQTFISSETKWGVISKVSISFKSEFKP